MRCIRTRNRLGDRIESVREGQQEDRKSGGGLAGARSRVPGRCGHVPQTPRLGGGVACRIDRHRPRSGNLTFDLGEDVLERAPLREHPAVLQESRLLVDENETQSEHGEASGMNRDVLSVDDHDPRVVAIHALVERGFGMRRLDVEAVAVQEKADDALEIRISRRHKNSGRPRPRDVPHEFLLLEVGVPRREPKALDRGGTYPQDRARPILSDREEAR